TPITTEADFLTFDTLFTDLESNITLGNLYIEILMTMMSPAVISNVITRSVSLPLIKTPLILSQQK
ncbi:hypothetical protein ABK046_49615, partial [Streptomyces caeruleatus]